MEKLRFHGQWKILLDGVELPVLHDRNWDKKKNFYFEYYSKPHSKVSRHIEKIRSMRVAVIQKSKLDPVRVNRAGDPIVHCVGYIGIFNLTNIEYNTKDRILTCNTEFREEVK